MAKKLDSTDLLGLTEEREGPVLRFGSVEVSHAVKNGHIHAAMNSRSTADAELDLELTAGQPIDYLSVVSFGHASGDHETIRFTGSVLEAHATPGAIRLNAETAPELSEQQMGYLEMRNAIAPEAMHLAVSTGGFPEERINIEGFDEMLPLEAIEVVVPVYGIRVQEPVDFGALRLALDASSALEPFDQTEASAEFADADAYLVGFEVTRRLLDAERAIVARVDDALAWLTVRARYGLAFLPDGEPHNYRRNVARARPRRGDMVVVRGMASGRGWLRAMKSRDQDVELSLDHSDPSWRPPPSGYELADRQALLACARAGQMTDPLERIQAIWEAIEFYVAGTRGEILFDSKEVKRIRRSVPKDVDPKLRTRALDLLAKINDPPLMAKLREAATRDGVPVAESEYELLGRLRKARNDAVHGRTPKLPLREDVDHAVSIVARLLVFRLARWRQQRGQS
jgi:hypothetical protein